MGIFKKTTPYVIGIGGRSCSGKSAVVRRLEKKYSDIIRINQDRFFKVHADSFERPDSIMNDRLIRSIKKLKDGKTTHIPSKGWTEIFDVKVKPHKLIILEGYLIFENKELSDLCDFKIWVDVNDVNLLYRRTKRDDTSRYIDYTMNDVITISKEYESIQKRRADIVIDGNKSKKEVVAETEKLVLAKIK